MKIYKFFKRGRGAPGAPFLDPPLYLWTINTYFYSILFHVLEKYTVDIEACVDMQKTVDRVSDCPRTKANWDSRSAKKNCSSVCLESRYHCLITQKMDSYIEVCTEPRYMQGK